MEDIVDLFPQHESGSKKSKVLLIGIIGLIGVSVMSIAFFGLGPMLVKPTSHIQPKTQDVSEVLGLDKTQTMPDTQPLANDQLEQLLKAISQQLELPQENSVRAYQITDLAAFDQSDFFNQAESGDIFIMFEPSKTVLLYSRLQGKVINQGQLAE